MYQLVKHLSVLYYFYKYFILLYCIKLYLECAQRLLRGKMGKKRGYEYRIVSFVPFCIAYNIGGIKAQKMTQGEKRKWACTKNDYVRSICIQKGITHKQPGQMKKLPQDLSFFLCMLISLSLYPLSPLSCCRKDNFLQYSCNFCQQTTHYCFIVAARAVVVVVV